MHQEKILNRKALVSIVMPCFNRENYIDESILSVVNQAYQNWELLIIDDGSSDSSIKKITVHAGKDDRIKLIHRDRNPKGACTCRNIGLQKAKGEYVIYLDSDDLLSKRCLENRVNLFQQHPENDFLVFSTLLFKERINDTNILWNIDTEEPDLIRFLRIDALWQTSGPIYKRNSLIEIGGFSEDLKFWQDFDLHLRFLIQNFNYKKFLNLPPDSYHRTHKESISRLIPFTENAEILTIRIRFYYSIIDHLKKYSSLKKYRLILIDVLFFFVSSFAIEHQNTKLFLKQWWKIHKTLRTCLLSHYFSIGYILLKKYSGESRVINYFGKIYLHLFKHILPNYTILDNTNLFLRPYIFPL